MSIHHGSSGSASRLTAPLRGRTVVVTGSASGIGRSTALRLAGDGATIVCADRHREARYSGGRSSAEPPTEELITARQGSARFEQCDVAQESDTEALFSSIEPKRSLWGAVLCAGVFERDVSILDETVEEHDRTMAVNERGVWLGVRAAGRALSREGSGGRIVCISSISGLVGLESEPSYCASKGAVVNLVRAAARDLAPYQITVNAVCPGFIETPMLARDLADSARRAQLETSVPLRRIGSPEEVAAAVAFLLSDDAAYITGVALPIDGGYTCG